MAWSDRPDSEQSKYVRSGLIFLALTAVLYLTALDRYPAAFGGDEAHFAIHARSLVDTGRDLNGRALPVFVRISDPLVPNHSTQIWYQPLLFYLMMPFVAVLGTTEQAARLPVALLAVTNTWLMYAVGRRLFADRRLAIASALLFAITPSHIIVSRQALDYIAPLPFVLGWMVCLLAFLDGGRLRVLAAGSFVLGAAVFSYIAAWLLMPLYFVVTLIAVWRSKRPDMRKAITVGTIAFAMPIALLVLALASQPDMLANTLTRYSVTGTTAVHGLAARAQLYWDYFNPSFLFFAGGANPTQATGRVGVFLIAFLPLLIAGLREIAVIRSDRATLVAVAFLASPLPIAITMPPAAAYSVARAMTLLPFGTLIAVYGLRAMWRSRAARVVAIALLIAIPLQFAVFAADYVGAYQERASPRLDPANVRSVSDAIVAMETVTPAPAIYFSDQIDDAGARWRFYMLKRDRMDLWRKSHQILLESAGPVEPGAVIVCYASDPHVPALIEKGYRLSATIEGRAGEAVTLLLKAPG